MTKCQISLPKRTKLSEWGSHGSCIAALYSSSFMKGQGTRDENDTREELPATTRTKRAISLISLQVHDLLSTIPKSSLKTKFFRLHLKVNRIGTDKRLFSVIFKILLNDAHTLNCRHTDMFGYELLPQPPGSHGIRNIFKIDYLHEVQNIRNFETHLTPRISDKELWDYLGDTTAQEARQQNSPPTQFFFWLSPKSYCSLLHTLVHRILCKLEGNLDDFNGCQIWYSMIKCMLSPYDEGQSVFGSLYEIEVIKSAFFKLTKTEKGSIGSI